jgi:hypothetical protein
LQIELTLHAPLAHSLLRRHGLPTGDGSLHSVSFQFADLFRHSPKESS